MLISVIVPTLNDGDNLRVALPRLAVHPDVELIVVDGGSVDHTMNIARQFTPYVFLSPPGWAAQGNTGARHATGDILLFLRPDTFLLDGALEELARRIIADGAVGGAFDLHLDSPRLLLQLVAQAASARMRLWRLPCGNHGMFVWRQMFERVGGFPAIPIMEDVAFARRLRRLGRLTFLRSGLIASARAWNAHGPVKVMLINGLVMLLHTLRVPPRQLRKIRDGWLPSSHPSVPVDHVHQRP